MSSNGFGDPDENGTFPRQYLSWYECQALLDTYKVAIAVVDESIALKILESLITTLAAKSGAGHPRFTASAVVGMAVHEVAGNINAAIVAAEAAAMAIEQQALAVYALEARLCAHDHLGGVARLDCRHACSAERIASKG